MFCGVFDDLSGIDKHFINTNLTLPLHKKTKPGTTVFSIEYHVLITKGKEEGSSFGSDFGSLGINPTRSLLLARGRAAAAEDIMKSGRCVVIRM